MRKTILISLLLFVCYITVTSAQNWYAVGTGTSSGVWALTTYKGNLYAGGPFITAGGNSANNVAVWNSASWDSVGSGMMSISRPFSFVNSLTVYDSNLIAGGGFDSAGHKSARNIAQWNGSAWSSLGSGLDNGPIALTVYNGNLIAGGVFDSAGGNPAVFIAQWDGSSWSALGKCINPGSNNSVSALAVYNGNLIAGGQFDSAGGVKARSIAQWNGSSWDSIGGGVTGAYPYIHAIAVYNGNLYVAGEFDSAGGKPANRIAEWNGSTWSALGTGVNGAVQALFVYDGYLIVAGGFSIAGGIFTNSIAQWNGSTWSALGGGMNKGSIDLALTTYNGYLVVGGGFDSAGGKPENNIAEWSEPLAVNEIEPVNNTNNVIVYPNPSNGKFTIKLSEASGQESVIEVYNVLGEKVFMSSFGGGAQSAEEDIIDLSGKPSGIYLYRVISEKGEIIGGGKLIKE